VAPAILAQASRHSLLSHAQTNSGAVGEIVWEISVDSTIILSHQHAASGSFDTRVAISP